MKLNPFAGRAAGATLIVALLGVTACLAWPARAQQKDLANPGGGPGLNLRYSVEIDGVIIGGMRSVSGVASENDIAVNPAAAAGQNRFSPGALKSQTLTIAAAFIPGSTLFKWRDTVIQGKPQRKSVAVILHNSAGEESGRLTFWNCWPTKWTGPTFASPSGSEATETLQLCYESATAK